VWLRLRELLRFESVDALVRVLRREGESERTLNTYLTGVYYFLGFVGCFDADGFVGDARSGRVDVKKLLEGFVDYQLERGVARKTVTTWLTPVKRWLEVNGVKVDVKAPRKWITYEDRIPTHDELLKVLDFCRSPRDRALICILASSGLRPRELVAIKYRDIKEDFEKGTIPCKVLVRAPNTKGKRTRITFISEEAVRHLKAYYGQRQPREDDPMIGSAGDPTKPVAVATLLNQLALLFKRAGLTVQNGERRHPLHPYSLRKFFRTNMSHAGVPDPYIRYFMGQKGYLDDSYFRANENMLREMYMKGMPMVTISQSQKPDKIEMLKAFAKTLGIKEIEVKMAAAKKAEPNLSEEEILGKIIREELGIPHKKISGDPKKVIKEDQLEHYLAQGWDVQTILPSGRILIRKPA
jgi:integrase